MDKNKTLKKGIVIFYIIILTIYGSLFFLLMKNKLIYLLPFLILFIVILKRYFKNIFDVTWKDLISILKNKKIS